jgi:hypothetical protein
LSNPTTMVPPGIALTSSGSGARTLSTIFDCW